MPVIGQFEVVREIGKSDLGTVYKAFDPQKKRSVALRVVPAGSPEAAGSSKQYLEQAKAASVLDSPNIASIYAVAEEEGLSYVVMEYIEGVPLDAALAGQQMFPTSELLDITRQVCRGLDHAHSKGLFHPWLKPASIVTEWDGSVKILDFPAGPGSLENKTGDEVRYMSPEQVQGRAPDARSNVFNWGAILYEMVSGRKAFGEGDSGSVVREILEVMPPSPHDLNAKLPIGISRVVMKALAKNPEYRFQRAGDMVAEMEAECEAANRPQQPEIQTSPTPQIHAAPPVSAPKFQPPPAAPAPAYREELLGYAVQAPAAAAPAPARIAAVSPPPAAVSVQPAPSVTVPGPAVDRIAPPPPQRVVSTTNAPVSLTPQQIKILVGVIGSALLVMLSVMIADNIHARRLRAEAEAAATAPLVNTATAQETLPPPPIVVPQPEPISIPEPESSAFEAAPKRSAKARHKAVVAPARLSTGELSINSLPQGAQVQVDGTSLGSTPLALPNLAAGQHTVVLSKAGYTMESRNVVIQSGTRAALSVSLNQLAAIAAIASDPPGASILIDGRDTGKTTPARVVVEKGSHSLLLRKAGYLDVSASMALNAGETFQFSPALKTLGNADDIKQVGKFKKLISRGGENSARVSVHTFPKGAQIMFNSRMMDRTSPAEFVLPAGTYQVTLSLSGYKPVHKTVTVESNGRMEINATFEQ